MTSRKGIGTGAESGFARKFAARAMIVSLALLSLDALAPKHIIAQTHAEKRDSSTAAKRDFEATIRYLQERHGLSVAFSEFLTVESLLLESGYTVNDTLWSRLAEFCKQNQLRLLGDGLELADNQWMLYYQFRDALQFSMGELLKIEIDKFKKAHGDKKPVSRDLKRLQNQVSARRSEIIQLYLGQEDWRRRCEQCKMPDPTKPPSFPEPPKSAFSE